MLHRAKNRSLLLVGLCLSAAFVGGCAQNTEESAAAESSDSIVADAVVVADRAASSVTVVGENELRMPSSVAGTYRQLGAGTILVGTRGAADSKNPDGFLRRIVRVRSEGNDVVFETSPAALTDAIVHGGLSTSSAGRSFDEDDSQDIEPHGSSRQFKGIAIDFSDKQLFENVDTIPTDQGTATFSETITLDRGSLSTKPQVDVDLRIHDGKVSRFSTIVQGNLDTSIRATATVTATGDVNPTTLAALAAKKHEVHRVIYQSAKMPLPTISVGKVPVSPSVQFTVAMNCTLSFGGPLDATAGVEAKSYVRLGASYADGAWGRPTQSEFDIRPSFDVTRGGAIDARCSLDAQAELTAFGGGITMSVAPYVDFDISKQAGQTNYRYRAAAGALGTMQGRADVFGIRPEDLDRPLVEWKAASALEGSAP